MKIILSYSDGYAQGAYGVFPRYAIGFDVSMSAIT